MGSNNKTINIVNVWGGEGLLSANITTIEIDVPLRLINIYGPCHNRMGYWNNLMSTSLLNYDKMIIGGDLNFSFGHIEPWGTRAQTDPLMEYFEHFMDNNNLMNIDSSNIQPTWSNRRKGDDALARKLD